MTDWYGMGRCFVCQKLRPTEKMGRVYLPLYARMRKGPWLRPICLDCYQALVDCWFESVGHSAPILHGY